MTNYDAKYQRLIDAETWEFIHRTNSWYPPETATFSIDKQRDIYNAMCREFFAGYPDGVEAKNRSIVRKDGPNIPLRIYQMRGMGFGDGENRPQAVVVYFHGGGFVVGGLESHDDVCAEICSRTGFMVCSVDYRLSPEHKHPAAFDDAMIAQAEMHRLAKKHGIPLLLVGDSAGGNLAACVCHARRTKAAESPVAGQVLIYPGLGGDLSKGSYVDHANAPMLTTADILFYKEIRGGEDGDVSNTPLHDTDFTRLPPTVIFAAECDPLASDGDAYRDAIIKAGGRAKCFNEAGMVHGYLRARHSVSRAGQSFDRIIGAIEALGTGAWPY